MKNNSACLHIMVSEDLKQKLEEEAYKRGLNLSTFVRMILIESFKKE